MKQHKMVFLCYGDLCYYLNMAKLTDKQSAFVEHYLQTWNATEAARRAEYNGTYESLRVIGSQNLTKPHIKQFIEQRMREMAMSADEVLARLAEMASADVSFFFNDVGVLQWDKVKEKGYLIKKIVHHKGNRISLELYDAKDALGQIGRHHQLFTDKIKIEDWRSEIIQLIREQKITREQVIAELGKDLATELFVSAGIPISTG
jgi:phage terminase small subunit